MYRVLVVDDEINNLQAIKRTFLDADDCEIRCVDNGYDALRMAKDFTPDVIVLDIMMPNMDGYEVCKQIKSNPKTAYIMVLFLSGKISLSDRLKGYEVLADDYIKKPFENDELLAKVKILIRLKKAQDELRETNQNLETLVKARTRQLVTKERQAIVGRMVQGIVHNFRNPLMAAEGFTNLISKNIESLSKLSTNWPNEQQDAINEVNDEVKILTNSLKRIHVLVDSLLIKGRKEGSNIYEKINLNELLVAELNFLDSDMVIKNSLLKKLCLDNCLPDFYGSYSEFSQVVSNMVQNAVDAMHNITPKEITIKTNHDFENIYIEFTDIGCGISAQLIDKIFDPFFSTKSIKGDDKNEEPTGSGLGLYSCQQLIEAYGGTIKVISEINVGTTFTVIIPYTKNQINNG